MTGYTVHTGSNLKFCGGWDRIFDGKPAAGKKTAKSEAVAAKKSEGKKAGKKKSAKKKK